MNFIKNYIKRLISFIVVNKKVFVLFSLIFFILVICVIGVIVLIVEDRSKTISKLQITNITSTGFTVTWISEEKEKGEVIVAKNGESFGILRGLFKKRFYDDRDIKQNDEGEWILKDTGSQKRHTHHVTIRGLEPESEYEFRIMGRLVELRLEDGILNKVRTQKISENLRTPDPVYGKVLDTKLEGKEGILIYANLFEYNESKDKEINISNTISTYTNSNGGYVFDLNSFYDINGNEYDITENTILKIVAINDEHRSVNKFNLKNYKPLPSIIFKKDDNQVVSNEMFYKMCTQVQGMNNVIFQKFCSIYIKDKDASFGSNIGSKRYQQDLPKSLNLEVIESVLTDLNGSYDMQNNLNILIYSLDNDIVVYDTIGDKEVYLASWYKPLVFTYIYDNKDNPEQYWGDMLDIITYANGPVSADNRLLYLINHVCGGRDNIKNYLEEHGIFLDYYKKNPYSGHLNGYSLVDSQDQIAIIRLLVSKMEEHGDLKRLFSVSDANLGTSTFSANWIRDYVKNKINGEVLLYKSASLLSDQSYLVIYKDSNGRLWGFSFIFKSEGISSKSSLYEINATIIELIEGKCIFPSKECPLNYYIRSIK